MAVLNGMVLGSRKNELKKKYLKRRRRYEKGGRHKEVIKCFWLIYQLKDYIINCSSNVLEIKRGGLIDSYFNV